MDNFFDLDALVQLADDQPLCIDRARVLVAAIEKNRDFTLVSIHAREAGAAHESEVLVVDVETDAVPPVNAVGIRYRERLALAVPADPRRLIEVLALRRDFPVLLHENMTQPGQPVSLCLYFEPVKSVLRSWTPQRFLRRIQWWLEKSATNDLHATDQPVEQLFFVSNYELVLPWNFDELSQQAGQKLT